MSETIKQGFNKLSTFVKNYSHLLCASFMSLAVVTVFVFLSLSVNTVCINRDGENICKLHTLKSNALNIVNSLGYSDGYSVSSVNTEGKNINIDICKSFPVYVIYNGFSVKIDITDTSCTVLDALLKTGLDIDDNDIISLPLTDVLNKETYIDIVSIDGGGEINLTEEDEAIPVSHDMSVTPEYSYNNITNFSEAGNVNTVSTLSPDFAILLDEDGNPVNYTSHMTVQATAYTYTGHRCATGVTPQPGYIAVNPQIIPYGTKMYIRSSDGRYEYGYAIAADTGGFVKSRPTNVDLFFSTNAQCTAFGRRNVEIYILE